MRCTCMQTLCLDCVVSNTVVASHFKLKKSTDKALVVYMRFISFV